MTHPDAPGCVIPGCTRPAAPGWQVCASDGQHMGKVLARIGDRVAQLDAAPATAAPGGEHTGGGTLASQRNPARLEVLVLRDHRSTERDPGDPDGNDGLSVFEVLHAHAEAVRETRWGDDGPRIPYPERVFRTRRAGAPGPICPTCRHGSCHAMTFTIAYDRHLTVSTERQLLALHLDWILGQDMAADLHADLERLWAAMGGGQRRTGHACPVCGHELLRDRSGAQCSACRKRWDGLALAELSVGKVPA